MSHCSTEAAPEQFERLWRHRVEGPTDPSEAETMSGLRCPRCKQLGILVLPYGPAADEVQSDVLVRLVPPRTERIEDFIAAVPLAQRLGAGTREARQKVSSLLAR